MHCVVWADNTSLVWGVLRGPVPLDLNGATWSGHGLGRQRTGGVSALWELVAPWLLLVSLRP